MADDELDELYAGKPEDFTALRADLAGAAKQRGDDAAAKRISGARKPTTAAWIVNRLALTDIAVEKRLTDLGAQLRSAHAAMDGDRIRELSTQQRRLVDELAKSAFEAADVTPTAAVRDAVTGTLQAAIADPDVAARLGRLAKAEQWSGFGEFGDTAIVVSATAARTGKAKAKAPVAAPKPVRDKRSDDKLEAARRQQQEHRAALATAERAKAEADEALSARQSDLAVARLRVDDARKRLDEADRGLAAAENAYGEAKQVGREAADAVKRAKARVKR